MYQFSFFFKTEKSSVSSLSLLMPVLTIVPKPQIKGTFRRTYTEAVKHYNAEDEASRAVDNLQHKVSPHPQD